MPDEAVLDLGRPDPVAGRLEHVVGATLVPQVAVVVGHRDIAGAAPVAGELRARAFRIPEVLEEEHRIGRAIRRTAVDGDFARLAARSLVAVVVEDGDPVTRIRTAHRAWL